uniref:Uncharacterized protein n=1 Tax=Octopus bimaculoides TaxID=37653 RepID=A0A0L8G7J1_OCTBM
MHILSVLGYLQDLFLKNIFSRFLLRIAFRQFSMLLFDEFASKDFHFINSTGKQTTLVAIV